MRAKLLLTAAALGAIVASGACSADAADSNVVRISIEHSLFEPAEVSVEPGSTVTFVITNNDPIDHEFIVGDETVQDVHERGTEAEHGDRPGEISIPAGEERTTTYTFEDGDDLIYGCHLPGHYDYGMRGTVAVGD